MCVGVCVCVCAIGVCVRLVCEYVCIRVFISYITALEYHLHALSFQMT